MKNYQYSAIKMTLVVCYFIVSQSSCVKRRSPAENQGFLNLNYNFFMQSYFSVLDSACGCTEQGVQRLAYYTPTLTIIDSKGKQVFSQHHRNIAIENLPLDEGKYSIHFYVSQIDFIPCDSARDIWKLKYPSAGKNLCFNKKPVFYKTIDSTMHFEIVRKKSLQLMLSF